ncbi:hypothetical protein [Streptomyces sp. NPDC029554]|uniref:hypothetical protein n=1 Tax=Streptomyces sp. NPDC029554 TaxID=3155126 RepID=UPI0033C7F70D
MTLNITVASRWLMAQSSDFRLTGPGGTASETSQKQVVLQYMRWSGLVCYTGVAGFDTHNTAAWLGEALTHGPGHRTPQEVADRLVEGGSDWLRAVPPGMRHHTFTMITYEDAKPYVYVISNFERPNETPLATPADRLICTRVRVRHPRCLVTGWAPAVHEDQREALVDLLAAVPEPSRLREEVAKTSWESSSRAEETVGQSCVVAHLCPDGSGEAQVFGNMEEEFLPTMITNGHNVASLVPAVIADAGLSSPRRLVGATWQANGAATAMVGAYRALSEQVGDGWS